MTVFVVNADDGESHELALDVSAFDGWKLAEHQALFTANPAEDYNDYDNPEAIVPKTVAETACRNGQVTAVLPPLSWNMLRFVKA